MLNLRRNSSFSACEATLIGIDSNAAGIAAASCAGNCIDRSRKTVRTFELVSSYPPTSTSRRIPTSWNETVSIAARIAAA